MGSAMAGETAGVTESPAAQRILAFVRFLAGVNAQMYVKGRTLFKFQRVSGNASEQVKKRLSTCINVFPQASCGQTKGRSPVCIRECRVASLFLPKVFWQNSQVNCFFCAIPSFPTAFFFPFLEPPSSLSGDPGGLGDNDVRCPLLGPAPAEERGS